MINPPKFAIATSIVALLFLVGCYSSQKNTLKDSVNTGVVGDNNFVVNAPISNVKYELVDIDNNIAYHTVMLTLIDGRIAQEEKGIDSLYKKQRDGYVSLKQYEAYRERHASEIRNLQEKRDNVEDVLAMWNKTKESSTPVTPTDSNRPDVGSSTTDNTPPQPDWQQETSRVSLTNCHTVSVQPGVMMAVRTRVLNANELSILNSCGSMIMANGDITYEDMSRQSCKDKKKLNDATVVTSLTAGTLVELIETVDKFHHIRIPSEGKDGWMAIRYAGAPTLVKANCE